MGLLALTARLLLAAVLIAAIVPTYRYAELAHLREHDPAAAYQNHSADARILASAIGERFSKDPSYIPSANERHNLRVALLYRPLSPDLISIQGLVHDAEGQFAEALAAMQLANQISRRSSLASLWLIEAASNEGDVPSVVGHYHNALSAHPALRDTLLPVLAGGIVYPEIRTALAPYLARPANWTGPFLEVAAKSSNASNLQALLTPLPETLRDETFQSALGSVLERLATDVGGEAATKMAADLVPGLDPQALSVLAPNAQNLDPRLGALAWRFPKSSGISTEPRRGGVLEIEVQPLANGLAAHRDMLVEGGKAYALHQRISLSEPSSDLRLIWRASCRTGGQTTDFWEKRINSGSADTVGPQLLRAPALCRSVTFAFWVEGPDGQRPVTVSLSSLRLKPLN
jgi:hypothetical protein